jgi:long-chain acyl-CoA synthetase
MQTISGAPQRATLCRGILPPEVAARTWEREAEFAGLNPALVRFSSGTTGTSKGVVLSHESLLARVLAGNSGLQIGPGDRVIWILPMAHHFAVSIVLYLLHGACTVLLGSHLAEDIDRGIHEHRGTVLYGAPFHYQLLAQYSAGRPHSSLRLAVSTAAPLSLETARAFQERYRLPLTQALGIIEVGLPLLNRHGASSDPLAVGKPQTGFEVRLKGLDAEGVGELLLRGPGLFDAYLSPWQPRAAVVDADGWFHTGDLCTIDSEGQVTLKGRTKSVINVAGIKVFAEQVEAVLNTCPGVKESRVVGEPHPAVGEIPVAELVASQAGQTISYADLLAYCRERLSTHHMPVKIRWVDSLPKTASGKLKRHPSIF